MPKLKAFSEGIYRIDGHLATKNLLPGKNVYGEELLTSEGIELRAWNPFRSKLAAAIEKGLEGIPLSAGSKVLYLGAAEGTTISHLSDIVGEEGIIFGIDISAASMRKFLYLCEQRPNIVPILADANQPQTYREHIGQMKADIIYQDISQRNQAEIFLKNTRAYLKIGGYGFLAVKARSISSAKDAKRIIRDEVKKLSNEFEIIKEIPLEPFDKEHSMVFCRRK